MAYNRDELRDLILKNISNKKGNKINKIVLDKHIEGLINEYIEKQDFIKKNGYSVSDNPTKEEMKWWFQDRCEIDSIETKPGVFEEPFEVYIDQICLNDVVASEVFKHLYSYSWKMGDDIHPTIKNLIKLTKLADSTKNMKSKTTLRLRLNNIAMVGVIRFYHLERKPYLTDSQINRAINFFRNALLVIDKVCSGEYKDAQVRGELFIFEAFRDDNKDKKK